ncbi:MAG: hypothetical protein AAFP19_03215 [Bacteroidota bacterium]
MQKNWYLILYACLLLSFHACGPSSQSECEQGKPLAIFSPDLPGVIHHQFEQKGQNATEVLTFKDSLSLQLFQSGCHTVKQEFRFQWPGNYQQQDAAYWTDQAATLFRRLASLSEKQASFILWAQAISAAKDQVKLGQATELEPGTTLKLDKVLSPDQVTLIIEFVQRIGE